MSATSAPSPGGLAVSMTYPALSDGGFKEANGRARLRESDCCQYDQLCHVAHVLLRLAHTAAQSCLERNTAEQ